MAMMNRAPICTFACILTSILLNQACGASSSAPTAPTTSVTTTPRPTTGGSISALVDGVAWSGSLTSRATYTNGILSITGQDQSLRVITLAVPISAALIPPSPPATASLTFSSSVHGTVLMVMGALNWDNGHAGGEGTFAVTSLTAARVAGTFTVTVVPSPVLATSASLLPAHITNGQFDMVLERF
jgi:hypothetical protein